MNEQNQKISRDKIFDLLSNSRRRYVLSYLSDHPEGATLQELARQLAAWENDIPDEEVTQEQQKRIYVSLYQTHLPTLSEAGVIDRESNGDKIVLESRGQEITRYLEKKEDTQRPWHRYYLAVVAFSTLVFLLKAYNVGPFGSIGYTVIVPVIIIAFAVLTGFYIVS